MSEDKELEVFVDIPEPPDADLVFDAAVADQWLRNTWMRLKGTYRSIRFEPTDMPEKQIPVVLRFVAQAICGDYVVRRQPLFGKLWVPAEYAKHPSLDELERVKGEKVAGFVLFRKPV